MLIRRIAEPSPNETLRDGDSLRGRRIAFYSHDSFGLGHLRRSLLLSEALCAADPSARVMLVTGSPRATFFDHSDAIEIVRLPAVTKDSDGHYVSRDSGRPLHRTVQQRKDILRSSLIGFAPDVLVVDHAPLGLCGELLPLLPDLKELSTKLVLGLRDILDDPEHVRANWSRHDIRHAIDALYDAIFVYGSQEVFDLGELYELPATMRGRIEYLGYLGRRNAVSLPSPSVASSSAHSAASLDPGEPLPQILCLVGGGGDGTPVAQAFVRAIPRLTFSAEATLVTGPFLPAADRRELQKVAAEHSRVHVLGFTAHLDHLIAASDVVVTMGGYNSLMEILSLGRRALVVPRVFPRREQWIRAQAFEKCGLVQTIDPSELEPATLARKIETLLAADPPAQSRNGSIAFDGVPRFVEALSSVIGASGSKERPRARHYSRES
ncbi:MAG: hypothetical protein KDC38_04190 [Planctomycetes bacterium]|nr:hypothetical protein [Planctomycetota bacterium]